jgi:hypothetical protein
MDTNSQAVLQRVRLARCPITGRAMVAGRRGEAK